ncbi:MAG TPA: fused MFS/spermidine synthase [Terriglobales bacterium]|nr:fused MFS/spermidine synthase [Terriglobales bacterium]
MSSKPMPALEVASVKSVDTTSGQTGPRQRWYFSFFLVSGFCSILYELIWLRLAMAQFGVTTPMVSIVLSSFMGGLGVGSLAAGRLIRKYANRLTLPPLQLYAASEILIGCSAVVVPLELLAGRYVLEHVGQSLSLSSAGYYIGAGVWLTLTLVPWCACMGATIPLGMFAIRSGGHIESRRSFSFLYLANVLGAVAGTLIPLLLIEELGFNSTLQIGMVLNLAIAVAALNLSKRSTGTAIMSDGGTGAPPARTGSSQRQELLTNGTLWLLFATGLTSMGLEVVWTRLYTIFVGTFVYSFAAILGVYLAATFIGSSLYRIWSRRHPTETPLVWLLVWLGAITPLLTADMRVGIPGWLRVPLGIALFSGLLGFLTPRLVDRYSEGDPDRAGFGYAVNVAGCILGPLVAGFVLLPHLDERYALTALALPWLCVGLPYAFTQVGNSTKRFATSAIVATAILIASFALVSRTRSYVQEVAGGQVRRDSTATVIAAGEGMNRSLFVNGIGMTILTPITKMMSAIPLAFLNRPPQNALVICFGMGTTHRSMLSWGIDSTVVDLVPSVPKLFWYYHADAAQLLRSPHSHVVVDDGRRFLERTTDQYDVIVIDPPPPIGAAGSSMLYSREFYSAAKKRLRSDGILQQWFPGGDYTDASAIARALHDSFPYVRSFKSISGWGIHFLASRQPIPDLTASELANRMPPSAASDLVEWGPFSTPEQQFTAVLKNEIPIDFIISLDRTAPAMQDDRPVNEYYLLRELRASMH